MPTKARNIDSKKNTVEEIKNRLDSSPTMAIVRYSKVSSNAMNELRGRLEEVNGGIKIYKNTLSSLALEEKYKDLQKTLVLNNALVFSSDDGLSTLKILKEFKKENPTFEIIGGVFDYKISSVEQLNTLADLPNKEGLLSMLLSVLQGKVRELLWGLKEVAEKKETGQ